MQTGTHDERTRTGMMNCGSVSSSKTGTPEGGRMCHYCGCRQMPLLRDYIAEHERVTDLGGDAVRAIDQGDLEAARRCITRMAAQLTSH